MAQQQDYLTPLLELYASRQQNKQLNDNYNELQNQQQQQLQALNSLYSPNSPYAQVMRQQLDRRDAASGRRSQYGPREVELQAKLAAQQGQANLAGLQALYSPQAMQLAQRQANTSPKSSTLNTLGYLNQVYKLGQDANRGYNNLMSLYRTYDTADKFNRFRDAVNTGNAIDDTVDPGLWSSAIGGLDYNYDFSIPTEYSGLGDLSNYADYNDYIDYASSLGDTASTAVDAYSAYDTAATVADTASAASDTTDAFDWLSWMDY